MIIKAVRHLNCKIMTKRNNQISYQHLNHHLHPLSMHNISKNSSLSPTNPTYPRYQLLSGKLTNKVLCLAILITNKRSIRIRLMTSSSWIYSTMLLYTRRSVSTSQRRHCIRIFKDYWKEYSRSRKKCSKEKSRRSYMSNWI